MALTIYATPDQLADWLEVPAAPDNANMLLRSATFVIARAIQENPYQPVVLDQARQDATCAQVAAWINSDIDPTAGGLSETPPIRSKGVDGANVDYDTSLAASVTAFNARQAIAQKLAPEAEQILQAAGILWAALPVWSNTPDVGPYVDELGRVGGRTWPWPE